MATTCQTKFANGIQILDQRSIWICSLSQILCSLQWTPMLSPNFVLRITNCPSIPVRSHSFTPLQADSRLSAWKERRGNFGESYSIRDSQLHIHKAWYRSLLRKRPSFTRIYCRGRKKGDVLFRRPYVEPGYRCDRQGRSVSRRSLTCLCFVYSGLVYIC